MPTSRSCCRSRHRSARLQARRPLGRRCARADTGPPPVDDFSPLLAESVQKHKLPGMAAAIVEDGRITAIGAAGVRCRGHKEPITSDDLFHIGSDTKSMTATLIAILVEEGKLRWNSTPVEVFAGQGVKEIDPAWKRVTARRAADPSRGSASQSGR